MSTALASDADEMLALLAEMTGAADAALRAKARRLAAQLFVDLAARGRPRAGGTRRMTAMPYRPEGGDLEVDDSLEAVAEARAGRRAVETDTLRVRGWARPATAWCLLVDRSGSMSGQPLATAGLAAAAITVRAEPGQAAVLCFARDVVVAASMGQARPAEEVIDRVLALRGAGTTDVAAALHAAAGQLDRSRAGRRVTVLLSDCRATEPGDVVAAASSLEELVILAPQGESEAAEDLAEQVGARLAVVAGPASVPAALEAVLPR